jgi:hypothetical protein
MNFNASVNYLGNQSLWSEDVTWLVENRAWYTLGHLAPRIRWMHLYLEESPTNDGVLMRIQLDVAGRDLASVCALRSCPQSAICAAFDLLREEIERVESVAV